MAENMTHKGAIGVFDSGFGGLSVLRELRRRLPQYDYLYLGDNARAPYGTRSFDVIHEFTLQAVRHLFDAGCPLVILACNTASAKALRSIQQRWLPFSADPSRRVLGVIRPTAESVSAVSRNAHIGIFATPGTVASGSYEIEIGKLAPEMHVSSHACPLWVDLVEKGYADSPGTDFFIKAECDALMAADPEIDTVVLACTHYPLLYPKIRAALPSDVTILAQGDIVSASLDDYLVRHPEMEQRLAHGGTVSFLTTECPEAFARAAETFLGYPVEASRVALTD